MAKIAIIGAGSVEFTRNILTDLCSYPELAGALEFALHDIDEERLGYAERAANQVVARLDAGHVVSAHADRRSAFDGADYLINEIQVGGYEATLRDFEIPKRYGLRQTIADTIGIGGIMRGLRTIPVMIEMADEMAERCPDGLLLNYTNPMAMVPWGIWAGSTWPAAQTIGVCHSVRDTHAFLASLVGVPEDRIAFRTAGFNHQCFVYEFRDRVTSEDLSRSPTAYHHLAVIAYNTKLIVPGRGSGIFLHASTGRPTLGCVSLPLPQLLTMLRWQAFGAASRKKSRRDSSSTNRPSRNPWAATPGNGWRKSGTDCARSSTCCPPVPHRGSLCNLCVRSPSPPRARRPPRSE